MRFEFNSAHYMIEFERTHRQVRSGFDEVAQKELFVPSKYPYTTVQLWKGKGEKGQVLYELHRTATVGAYHKEPNITNERGRLLALRMISKTLSKDLKAVMWDAYMNRGKRVKA